jgi:hypothetical protein
MDNHLPDAGAISDVVAAFANAPVVNPGGNSGSLQPDGVQLHVLVDNEIPLVTFMPFNTDDNGTPGDTSDDTLGFHDTKNQWFGTNDEVGRQSDGSLDGTVCSGCLGTAEQVLTLKRQVYHWGLWGNEQADSPGSTGTGEVNGNDFWVTLGSFAGGVGSRDDQAATFMHELGHNLGLHHGGPAGALMNCKPHLFSVMNYAYQLNDWAEDRPLDYSRQTDFIIDTNYLSEESGFPATYWPDQNDNTGQLLKIVYGGNNLAQVSDTGIAIDWNGDGFIELNPNTVSEQIQFISNIPGCDNTYSGPIKAKNQWPLLDFDFRTSDVFASGASQEPTSNPGQLIKGLDEPGKDFFEGLAASNLSELENLIAELQIDNTSQCTDAEIDDLENELGFIRDILTTGSDPRNKQLKDAAIALEELKNSELFQCLGDDGTTAANSGIEGLVAANSPVLRMIIDDVQIDLKSKGVIDTVVFGSEFFDVSLINHQETRLGECGSESAPISHEFSSDSIKNSHIKDVDQDGWMDVFYHFSQNTIVMNPGENQEVCLIGETTEIPAQSFTSSDFIDVISGKGKGPNN